MASKSKIRFEWDGDREGILWAVRDRGKITMDELLEALHDAGFTGYVFAILFHIHEDGGFVGLPELDDDPKGDVWRLLAVQDGEPCPVCGETAPPQYCPDCGKYLLPLTKIGGATNG